MQHSAHRTTWLKHAVLSAKYLSMLSGLLLPITGFCAQLMQTGVTPTSTEQAYANPQAPDKQLPPGSAQAKLKPAACPAPTALSTLVQPNQLLQLENRITHTLQLHRNGLLADFFARFGRISKPLSHDVSISVPTSSPTDFRILRVDGTAQGQNIAQRPDTARGYHKRQLAPDLQLQWHDSADLQPVVTITFAQSEQAGPQPDQLAWTLNIAAMTANQVYVSYQLTADTVIAGASLATWRGQATDAVKLTPCMQQHMLRLSEAGMTFRQQDGRPSAFTALAAARMPAASYPRQRCAIMVYQADQLRYRFDADLPHC